MNIGFNTNVKLLMGGCFCGNLSWNKPSSSIDNCFKLYFVRSGKALVFEKNHTYELNTGKIYLLNGYKLVSQKCLEPFVVDWIHFLPKSLYLNYTLKQTPLVTELPIEAFASFNDHFNKFEPFFSTKLNDIENRCSMLEIQSLIYFSITKIFRLHDSCLTNSDEQLQRIVPSLEYIAENYTNPISLQELAEKCCVSPNYFHKLFMGVFKVSPLNYVRNLRMDEAIRQLVYTNFPVKSIAYNIGYDDEAYFSRVFSKQFGTSPGSYRKNFSKKIP